MRPIIIAKLLGLTLFALYLALGFAHAAGDATATNVSVRYGPA